MGDVMRVVDRFSLKIGMTVEECIEILKNQIFFIRVVERDHVRTMVDQDDVWNRINIKVVEGVVTEFVNRI